MDENYARLLEDKISDMDKRIASLTIQNSKLSSELAQLKENHKILDKSYSWFVFFVIVCFVVIFYLGLSYGVDMYHVYKDFADFENSLSDFLRSIGYY